MASLHFFLSSTHPGTPTQCSIYFSEMTKTVLDSAWWRYLTVMVQMKTCDCVMTVLWSHHIRHHKIFRSGRHTGPRGEACHDWVWPGVTGRVTAAWQGASKWSTLTSHLRAPTRSEQSTGIKTPEVERDAGCRPFLHLFLPSVPIFLLRGYCHKSPRCWRHAVSVSRVTCCHAAGNKIPHHSHNSSRVQTFQVNSLLSTLLRLLDRYGLPLYCNALCGLIAPDTMISLIWCRY